MAEHERRAKGRALLNKAGYGSAGGHLTKHPDKYATKHEITEAVHEHEGALHKGSKKTRIRLRDGGLASGGMTRPRSDRKPRGGKGKGHTTVNVVVGHGGSQPHPVPVPVPVPAGGPLGGGMPPGGPPMPPDPSMGGGMPPGLAGAGGPPMPGQARGGRTGYKKGGSVRDKIKGMPDGEFKKGGRMKMGHEFEGGAGGGLGRLEKAEEYGAKVKRGGRS